MSLSKLRIEKSIEIHAPAARVWDLLTKPGYNCLWAAEFSGGTSLAIESAWGPGSRVRWRTGDNRVILEGNVTAVQLDKLLCFTVQDVRDNAAISSPDKDSLLTFRLSEESSRTTLRIFQEGFSRSSTGRRFGRLYEYAWDRVLPHIKRLAESQ